MENRTFTMYSSSPEQRKLATVLLIIGILLSFILIGLVLIAGYLKIRFARREVSISEDEIRMREATWVRLGKAVIHSQSVFPAVSVLSKQLQSVSRPAFFFTTSTKWSNDRVFRLVVLSEDHRKKIELQEYTSREEAMEALNGLVQLGFQAEKFSPKISEASRKRRERSRR